MPFTKLLASNKGYENLFLNRLLTPACSGRFQREKQSREQVLGEGEVPPAFQCLPRKEEGLGGGEKVIRHPEHLTNDTQGLQFLERCVEVSLFVSTLTPSHYDPRSPYSARRLP